MPGSWPGPSYPTSSNPGGSRSRQEVTLTAASSRPRRNSRIAPEGGSPSGPSMSLRVTRSRTTSNSGSRNQIPTRVFKRKQPTTVPRSVLQIENDSGNYRHIPTRRRMAIFALESKIEQRRSTSVSSSASANGMGPAQEVDIQQQLSPLLGLPAEIRNMIWKLTVVSHRSLNIVGSLPEQPALTRTCKQIRLESIGFFYRLNNFHCIISNYDPSDFKRYRKTADKYGLSTVLLTHQHTPDADRKLLRTNILRWLEGTYKGDTAPLGYSAGHNEESFVWDKLSHRIVKVFNQAKVLRQHRIPWSAAEELLANAVDAAGVCGEKRR